VTGGGKARAVEAGTITCANCGATVAVADEEHCPECAAPIRVVCPNCGEHALVDDDACPSCGESLAHGAAGP